MTAEDRSYHPDCFLCRKEAGKTPAGVAETHLCRSHVQSEWLKEKAEVERLSKSMASYIESVKFASEHNTNWKARAEAEVQRLMVLATQYSDERIAAEAEAARERERARQALDALEGMVGQHCAGSDKLGTENEYDSFALSANAEAMRVLSDVGRFKIVKEAGRRIIGHFVEMPIIAPSASGEGEKHE